MHAVFCPKAPNFLSWGFVIPKDFVSLGAGPSLTKTHFQNRLM